MAERWKKPSEELLEAAVADVACTVAALSGRTEVPDGD